MTDYDVLKEEDDLRVVLMPDYDAWPPEDDGMAPLLEIDYSGFDGWRVRQVEDVTSYEVDSYLVGMVEEIYNRYAARTTSTYKGGLDRGMVLKRYLSIFWGVTKVQTLSSCTYQGGSTYLAIDPADWRKEMGITDEWLQEHSEDYSLGTEEWQAYLDGDAYGYRVEELVTWKADGYPDKKRWEELESCWGFYGRQYAEESALEAYGSVLEGRGQA